MSISRVGKTKYGRPILHFEGIGYWIVPAFVSTSIFNASGYRYLKFIYCYGEGQRTLATVRVDSDSKALREVLNKVLDYLESHVPGFYHANARHATFDTEPYTIECRKSGITTVRWLVPAPLVKYDPSLKASNSVGTSVTARGIEVLRQRARRLREECNVLFDDAFKVTREQAAYISPYHPLSN